MPSIVGKRIRGRTYYYAVWSRRVDGRPRIVRQKYLGRTEQIVAGLEGAEPPAPRKAVIGEFGAPAALFQVAERLGLADLVDQQTDQQAPKRTKGLTAGQYMVLAAIHRAARPIGKRGLEDWYRGTILTRWIPAEEGALASERFWDHVGSLKKGSIRRIQDALARRVIERFGVDLRSLVYGGTSLLTFTTVNARSRSGLARRGHERARRSDLRQVSLGLLVSRDFHVPLFHDTYDGNVHDPQESTRILKNLLPRCRELGGRIDLTVVFEKEASSKASLAGIDRSPFHFIGSLVPSQHPDLLEVPLHRFRPLEEERLRGVKAYRTTRKVFGAQRTVVVTHDPRIVQGQQNALRGHLRRKLKRLGEIQQGLTLRREGKVRGGRAPTLESVRAQVDQVREAGPFRKLIRAKVRKTRRGPSLTFRLDQTALERYGRRFHGKAVIFTDNHDWPTEDIVLGHQAQDRIEDAFRERMDPEPLCSRPQFHWTDQKIAVQAFSCVLALQLTSLLQRDLHDRGMDMSIPSMLDALRGIQEVVLIYPARGPTQRGCRKGQVVLSDMDETQERIFRALGLERFQAG